MSLAAQALSVRLGRRIVLEGADVTLTGGELVGIVGPNGAGKSTLVRALLGLLPPAAGHVTLDGAALPALPRAAIARRIAYLPQGQTLHWPLAVERVVALGRLPHLGAWGRPGPADRAAIERAMARADIAALRHRIATDLSGGERARVLLARALAVVAPALIVDEPLAALDPAHQLDLIALLAAEAAAGTLVVAVLHDLGLAARHCTRLLLLDAGRIVADGAPGQVLTPATLRAVFGIEAWFGTAGGAPAIVPLGRSRA